jgi:hypothetical protein
MALFSRRIAPAQSQLALTNGLSLLARVKPVEGLTSLVVDLAPSGPRFDILGRRSDGRSLELRLTTSVIPRLGETVVVAARQPAAPRASV